MISVQVIVAEKFSVLFISDAGIDQDQPVPFLDQQTAQGPGAKVIGICRIRFFPDGLGHHAKHGAAVKFEEAGFDGVELHLAGS